MKIEIVGGIYEENCEIPHSTKVRGSGGRAALFLAGAAQVALHSCVPKKIKPFTALAQKAKVTIRNLSDVSLSSFRYLHPLSAPEIKCEYLKTHGALQNAMMLGGAAAVSGNCILKYGMLEGDVQTKGEYVIYDPQSSRPKKYSHNGSTAKNLAIVGNEEQIRQLANNESGDIEKIAKSLLPITSASVVVAKMGSKGCLVIQGDKVHSIPAYLSDAVHKIGTGDIFSAAFSYFWAIKRLPPNQAADLASRATSKYVETGEETFYSQEVLQSPKFKKVEKYSSKVYLAAPFFDIGQKWLVDEIIKCLTKMECKIFSPYHEVGIGKKVPIIVREDLAGLNQCDVVLAVADGTDVGTIFEVGYAVAKGIKVVVLAHRLSEYQLTMLKGAGCIITGDMASAVYHAVWGQ